MANPNMPHGEDRMDGNGYVVYTRESTVNGKPTRWEYARLRQKQKIEDWYSAVSVKPTLDQYKAVGQYLIGMGQTERQKEIALMKATLGEGFNDADDEKLFINQFNYAIVGQKQYEDALHRIKIGLDKEGENGKGLAPAISSLFASKFNSIFGKRVNDLIRRHLKDADTDEKIEAAIEKMEKGIITVFNNSVDKAIEETLTYQNASGKDDKYGTLKGYEDLYNLYKSNPIYEKIFKESISKLFNIEKIKDVIRNNKSQIKQKGKMHGWSWANKALSIQSRAGQIGGIFNEGTNMLRDAAASEIIIGENGTRTARQVVSNKLKTDNVLIFQTEVTIDEQILDEELAKLSREVDATKNLIEAHKVIEDFWNKNLSKLNDGFVVFKSGKAYGLNNISKHGGFKGSDNFSIGNLKELPKSPTLSQTIDIDKFVLVIANTIPDTILENNYGIIREWLYTYVTESIASLLFDDWEQIGTEVARGKGSNAIHVMTLEDVNIPFSVFLIGAGRALISAVEDSRSGTDFIRMTLHKSKNLYPTKDSYREDSDTWDSAENKPLVARAWRKQRADALQNYTISIQFYKNFNEEILQKILNGVD